MLTRLCGAGKQCYLMASDYVFLFFPDTDIPLKDCKDINDSGLTTSGLYTINLRDGNGEFTVFCDMTLLGGGWTVIQRRIDDNLDFEKNWDEYVHGFGNFNENFWLGLDKIKRITDMGTYELYIGLENFYTTGEKTAWSKYATFSLGSAASYYPLTIGTHDTTSTAGDSLSFHNGEAFSTKDKDNDSHQAEHCSQTYKGGWWYKNCHDSNLNGKWYDNGVLADPSVNDGIIWEDWISDTYSLKTSVIAVRKV